MLLSNPLLPMCLLEVSIAVMFIACLVQFISIQFIPAGDPHNDPNAQGDAFKTLFVARVNYDTTESKLRREFEVYGPIKRIYIVYNKRTGKPRGYAFIEYEHERDMHCEYLCKLSLSTVYMHL